MLHCQHLGTQYESPTDGCCLCSQESSDTYNAAMAATGGALVQAASTVLTQQAQEQLSFEGDSDEFGQRLCETMAEFGSSHLHSLPSHDAKILFLQQARSQCQACSLYISSAAAGCCLQSVLYNNSTCLFCHSVLVAVEGQ